MPDANLRGMDESKYEKSVKDKVKQIEGKGPVHQEALLRLIDHRVCPDEYNFEEIYAMYSIAKNLRIFDPPANNPHYCRGYDSAYPCGSETIDRWPGVTCEYGRVISLKISGKKKYGSCCGKTLLPNKSCVLKGEIPSQIKYLKYLQELSLDNHLITGKLPPIGELKNLIVLQLSLNNIDGTLPEGLYSLKNLKILDINDNNFAGTIHYNIEKMKSLELVSIYNNKFNGEIPWTSVATLKRLYILYLDGNNFSYQRCSREICSKEFPAKPGFFTVPHTIDCHCAMTV